MYGIQSAMQLFLTARKKALRNTDYFPLLRIPAIITNAMIYWRMNKFDTHSYTYKIEKRMHEQA